MAEHQLSYYVIDGVQYPRVTNILKIIDKPGLSRWRGRLGNAEADRVAKAGSDFGTEFHALASDINRGEHLKRGWQPPGEFRNQAFAYIDWLHKHVSSIQAVEKRTYSPQRCYAGTLDLLATIRGDSLPSIIDIKTSNNTSIDWPLQLTAYKEAEEELGQPIQRRLIVRVPKTAPYDVVVFDYKNHDDDSIVWDNTLRLWLWCQGDKERHSMAKVVAGF